MAILHQLLGVAALLALAWALSENRRAVRWRTVAIGMLLALALAATMLKLPPVAAALQSLNAAVEALNSATLAGTSFVFGYLGGGQPPFAPTHPQSSFILAFQALPLVLVISARAGRNHFDTHTRSGLIHRSPERSAPLISASDG